MTIEADERCAVTLYNCLIRKGGVAALFCPREYLSELAGLLHAETVVCTIDADHSAEEHARMNSSESSFDHVILHRVPQMSEGALAMLRQSIKPNGTLIWSIAPLNRCIVTRALLSWRVLRRRIAAPLRRAGFSYVDNYAVMPTLNFPSFLVDCDRKLASQFFLSEARGERNAVIRAGKLVLAASGLSQRLQHYYLVCARL
jgi:hypothetical protein